MARRFSHTTDDYERMIGEIAREAGYKVGTVEGIMFFTVKTYSSSGEEVLARINITHFAEMLVGRLS